MRRLLLPIVLAGLAVFGFATPALAHNVLVGSSPASGASVATGPGTVSLTFDAPVQFGANTLTVIGPDGQHWEKSGNATVNGDSVSTAVAPLGPAGVYKVGYRIISADGHPVSGEVSFTLTKAGTGTPPQQSSSTAAGTSGSGGVPVWAWVLGAVVLLGVGLFFGLRMPRMGARRG
ncbi:MAG TPA: copper resistance CopC family protein [Pseudonocardiaceae bacterium]|nr:copper resistance CopC family protein [Pseudonocardiaceae bacterium]